MPGRAQVRPALRPLPRQIAGIDVPQDDVSAATWRRAQRSLPTYLLFHSVRSYCWGAAIGAGEGWAFDRQVLWTASLLHDRGLTTIPANDDCFEVAGGGVPDAGSSASAWRPRRPSASIARSCSTCSRR